MLFNNISQENQNRLMGAVNFTPEQLKDMEKIEHVIFFGYRHPFPKEDLWIFSTIEGIEHQLNKFTLSTGFVYVITDRGSENSQRWEFSKYVVQIPQKLNNIKSE